MEVNFRQVIRRKSAADRWKLDTNVKEHIRRSVCDNIN